VSDNGPKFAGSALDRWGHEGGPGKPVESAFIESFNGKIRDECLTGNCFTSLSDVQEEVEVGRRDYSRNRPHGSLGYKRPEEFRMDSPQPYLWSP
jgi:putative transposase